MCPDGAFALAPAYFTRQPLPAAALMGPCCTDTARRQYFQYLRRLRQFREPQYHQWVGVSMHQRRGRCHGRPPPPWSAPQAEATSPDPRWRRGSIRTGEPPCRNSVQKVRVLARAFCTSSPFCDHDAGGCAETSEFLDDAFACRALTMPTQRSSGTSI